MSATPPKTLASATPHPAGVDGTTGPGDPSRPALVEVHQATAVLGGRTVWSQVDATVSAGEFVAILGPNGVGKSTLLKAILGLVPLADGDVRLLGRRPGQANHEIGFLPQRRSFDATLRVRVVDVVRLGFDGDRWGLPLPLRRSGAAAARVAELVELVGGGAYAHRPIGQLSGGEQQRAAHRAGPGHDATVPATPPWPSASPDRA